MERILIREDPKVFLKHLQEQKAKEELKRYGKDSEPSIVEVNHPKTYFEAKPVSMYEDKKKEALKQQEINSFKN